MRILLVRHGESEHNAGLKKEIIDSPLTKKGIMQAKKVAKRLKKFKIDKIYTSNLSRAKKTAEIISHEIKVPVKKEFHELSEYKGKHLRSRLKILFNSRLRKLKKLLNNISKEKENDESILIVAHGVTNRIIIGHLLEIPIKKQLLYLNQENTCINELKWDSQWKNWKLNLLNCVSHLK
jgi:phosphoserine phosphatase